MSKFYCPAPWTGGYFTFREQAVCCADTKIPSSSPLQFMNSEYVKNMRRELLAGTPTGNCLICKQKEEQGFQTIRKGYEMTDRMAGIEWIYDIDAPSVPKNIEVRFDNHCNFKCRMCGPDWSHLLAEEVRVNPNLKRWVRPIGTDGGRVETDQAFVEEILSMAPNLKQVYLTGGEPTISKPSMYFLDQLIERGHAQNMALQFATNTSVINPGYLDKLLKFKRVNVIMSIDATGTVAEYQRHGTDWSKVSANIEKYLQFRQAHPGKINTSIHCVITAYTVMDADRMMTYVFDLFRRYGIFGLGITVVLGHADQDLMLYSALRLGGRARIKAIDTLDRTVQICEQNKDLVGKNTWLKERLDQFVHLSSRLKNEPVNDTSWEEFKTWTREFDLIRGESFESTFGVSLD